MESEHLEGSGGYLMIASPGRIEEEAFTLLGASTKRGSKNKIGMFGSGLKYALAYLIRNGHEFEVWSGNNEIKFGTKIEKLGNQEFSVITVNDRATSITTDFGPEWEPWYVIRELFTNSLDENPNATMKLQEGPNPHKRETRIFLKVEDNEFSPVIERIWEYFAQFRKDLVEDYGHTKLYRNRNGVRIYRKGILVYSKKNENALYDYDLDEIEINESRQLASSVFLEVKMDIFWGKEASVEAVRNLIDNMKEGHLEQRLVRWDEVEYSENWDKALEGRSVVEEELAGHYEEKLRKSPNCRQLPSKMVKPIVNALGQEKHVAGAKKGGAVDLEQTEKDRFMLNRIEDFTSECHYEVQYPIKKVRFAESDTMGLADEENEEILIGEDAFRDMFTLLKVIVEENEHLKTGKSDGRPMQDHFLDLFLVEKMERYAYVI